VAQGLTFLFQKGGTGKHKEKSDQSKTKSKHGKQTLLHHVQHLDTWWCDLCSKNLRQSCPYGLSRHNQHGFSWVGCAHCLWPSLCILSTFLATDLLESPWKLRLTLTASHLDLSMDTCTYSGPTVCCLTSQAFLWNLSGSLYDPIFLAVCRPKNKHHVGDDKVCHLIVLYSLGSIEP
jgi:hypothetical protein